MNPIIKISDIDFTFDPGKPSEVHALNHISLDVMPGEYVAFFGPSGCGKTTLLYTIAGIQQPQTGNIIVDGEQINSLSRAELAVFRQTKIGIIFQSFNLLPTLSVLDNVALPMAFLGVSETERKARAADLLNRVGLGYLAERYPTELSGGQQQRVSIARSIANDPSIILADEPLGNLDSANAKIVLDQLNELRTQYGKTIVMVTHEVWTLRDVTKIFFMRDGEITSTQDRVPGEMSESASEDLELIKQKSMMPNIELVSHTVAEEEQQQPKELQPEAVSPEENKREELFVIALESPAPTPEPISTLQSTTLLSSLYPELSRDEVRVKALTELLMNSYSSAIRKRFELFLGQRRFGALSKNEFFDALDRPWNRGGIGLWKQTAARIGSSVDEYISQWDLIDQMLATLERDPRTLITLEIAVIIQALEKNLEKDFSPLAEEQFSELLEEKMRGIITWDHFEKVLSVPKKMDGFGLRGTTPQHVVQILKPLLAERDELLSLSTVTITS